jgi:MOSC domain-containing protein YiiM
MASVLAVAKDSGHCFSKQLADEIYVVAGQGVEGDAHSGASVQHLSRVAADPTQPNLRQVHLIQAELFDDLAAKGFRVTPGAIGENITTSGLDLLALPCGALLQFAGTAVLEVTGLRNPCAQLDHFQKGLMAAVLDRGLNGELIRKAGIMAIVRQSGAIKAGDAITVILPRPPHLPLGRV